jgi:hypothetical protein
MSNFLLALRGMPSGGNNQETVGPMDGAGAERRQRATSLQSGAARAAVLDINDGLVTNISLILGVVGATATPQVVQLAGLASLVAGAASMAVGEYISMRAQVEFLERLLEEERNVIMVVTIRSSFSGGIQHDVAQTVMRPRGLGDDSHLHGQKPPFHAIGRGPFQTLQDRRHADKREEQRPGQGTGSLLQRREGWRGVPQRQRRGDTEPAPARRGDGDVARLQTHRGTRGADLG